MKGACLCGSVTFKIEEPIRNLYQCHCSLCRKATGAAANAATFVQCAAFHWLSGEGLITSYKRKSGFRSDFCSICGSPVPNNVSNSSMVWIPAGLLEEPVASQVSVHLHTRSAAPWERESAECIRLEGGADSLASLNNLL